MRTRTITGWVRTAALVLPLAWTACDSKTARALKPGEFLSNRHDFSITFPTKWEQKKRFMGAEIVALSPRDGSRDRFQENVNVVVERLPSRMTVEEYVDANMQTVENMLTDFKEYRSGDKTVDGENAHWKVISHRMGQFKIKCLVYFFVEGRKGYVVTCSAMPKSYSSYERKFRKVAESLRFE